MITWFWVRRRRAACCLPMPENLCFDAASGSVTPVDISYRRINRPIPAGQNPGALRFDPGDKARLLLVVRRPSLFESFQIAPADCLRFRWVINRANLP